MIGPVAGQGRRRGPVPARRARTARLRSRLPAFRRLGHLDQPAGLHVVDIAVDGHASGDEGVGADAGDVGGDALGLVLDGQPIDEIAFRGARRITHVLPAVRSELRGVQALSEERAHHLVGEGLHAAVGVVDHEPLLGAEQLVGDDEGADGVIARAAAGVADDMRVR